MTVSGTTYYLTRNAFYRRVVTNGQETFVIVTPPAGVVFVAALPADFEVVQLNTMYFGAGGQYYVPYPVGRRQGTVRDGGPPAAAAGRARRRPPRRRRAAAASRPRPPPSAPAVRAVAESFSGRRGTLLVVRLAADLSSDEAKVGDRFQGFLDQDLAAERTARRARGRQGLRRRQRRRRPAR